MKSTNKEYTVKKSIKELSDYTKDSKILFVDTETTGLNPYENEIRLIQVKNPDKEFALIVDFANVNLTAGLFEAFENKKLVFHNAKFDLSFLSRLDKRFLDLDIEDTMLIGKAFEPENKHSLKDMVKKHLGIEIDKTQQKSNWNEDLSESQYIYAALDVIYLEELFNRLQEKYNFNDNLVYKIEKNFIKTLIKIEQKGIKLDFEKALEFLEDVREEYTKIENQLLQKYRINPRSPQEVAKALISEGVELPKTKKGNYSTSEDVLKFIDHDIARNIIKIRKLKNSIDLLESYITACDENYRIHSTFNSWKTVSGRMSSENPNIQNVPVNEKFRELFTAEEGNVLLGADYPQIELRIAAKYTDDETMINALKNEVDLHKLIVSKATGKPYKEITKEERKLGKPVNFGLLYGMSAKTLRIYAKTIYGINLSEKEAIKFKKVYKETYKGINEWQDKTIRKIKKNGFIQTVTLAGRKAVAKRYTDALNYPIQGTGADMIKLACIYFEHNCKKKEIDAQIVNIVHDEILVEVKENQKDIAKKVLKTAMESAAKRFLGNDIPCPVEVKEGKNWNEIKD